METNEKSTFPSQARAVCAKNRVLIVDDDDATRQMMFALMMTSFPAVTADMCADGEAAIAAFGEKHHALVVTDVRMPRMNGEQLFQEIGKTCTRNYWEKPHVIFVTGYGLPPSLSEVLRRDKRHRVLFKAFTVQEFVEAVTPYVGPPSTPPASGKPGGKG